MSLMGGGKAGPEAPRLQLGKAVAQRAIELVELCHPDGPLHGIGAEAFDRSCMAGEHRVVFAVICLKVDILAYIERMPTDRFSELAGVRRTSSGW